MRSMGECDVLRARSHPPAVRVRASGGGGGVCYLRSTFMMNEGMLRIEKPGRLYALITSSTAARNAARRAVPKTVPLPTTFTTALLPTRRLRGAAAPVPPREESEASAAIRCGAIQAVGAADRLPRGQGTDWITAASRHVRAHVMEHRAATLVDRSSCDAELKQLLELFLRFNRLWTAQPAGALLRCDAMRCDAAPRHAAAPRRHRTDDPSWPSKGSVAQQAWE